MTDAIASLSFGIDSSQTVDASKHLDNLKTSADRVGESHRALASRFEQSRASFSGFAQDANTARLGLNALNTSVEAMLQRLSDARAAIGSTVDSFKTFDTARTQVDALARSFGASAVGMEAFSRQAGMINITGNQMLYTMSRITAAIENQTAAGKALRATIQSYGVDLAGMTANDADVVLDKFTTASRGYKDTPGHYATVESVLGPVGFDVMGKVNNPDYVTMATQEQRQRDAEFNWQIAEQQRNNSLVRMEEERAQAREADLRSRYRVGYFNSQSNGFGPATVHEQRAQLEKYAANPDSPDARFNRFMGKQIGDAFREGGALEGVGNWWRRPKDLYSANEQALQLQYQQETDEQGGMLRGNFGPTGRAVGRSFSNLFNNYTPDKAIVGTLPLDPNDIIARGNNAAATLAAGGDNRLQQQMAAAERVKSYETGDALKQLTETLSQYAGDPNGVSAAHMIVNRLKASALETRNTAMEPAYASNMALGTQNWIGGLGRADRGNANDLLAFVKANVPLFDPNNLSGRSVESMVTPGDGQRDLSATEIAAFRRQQGREAVGGGQALANTARQDLEDQRGLLSVAGQRMDIQDRFNRELALEKETRDLMDKARLAGGSAVADLQAQIDKTRELREQMAQNVIVIHNMNDAQARQSDADNTRTRTALPTADDRAAYDRMMPAIRSQLNNPGFTKYLPDVGSQLDPAVKREIDEQARIQGFDPKLYYPIALQERGGGGASPMLWGPAINGGTDRAYGPAQLTADTAATLHVDRMDFKQNIRGGVTKFGNDLQKFHDPEAAAGAYVMGTQGEEDYLAGKRGMGPESQKYVTAYRARITPTAAGMLAASVDPNIEPSARANISAAVEQAKADQEAIRTRADAATGNTLAVGAARRGAAGQGAAAQGRAAAGVVNPEERDAENEAGRRVAQYNDNLDTRHTDLLAANKQEIADQDRLTTSIRAGRAERMLMAAAIEAEKEARASGLEGAQKEQYVTDALTKGLQAQTKSIAEQRQQQQESAADNRGLAAAWRQGPVQGQAAQRELSLAPMTRDLDAADAVFARTGEGGAAMAKRLAEARAQLNGLKQDMKDAAEDAGVAKWAEKMQSMSDSNTMMKAEIDAGPLASPRALADARANVTADQAVHYNPGLNRTEVYDATKVNNELKQTIADQQQIRQGWNQMGSAMGTAFEGALIQGAKIKPLLREMWQSLETIALRTIVEKPIEKAMTSVADTALTGVSSWINGLLAASAGAPAATGAVFSGGTRTPFAAGGIIDRPTLFPMATGSALTGEAGGPEAVVPLKRMPNGNLGVQMGGSGGGGVTVHAPITIQQSGGGGGGKLDAATLAAVQKQIATSIQMSVRSTMAQEKRNGGDLYQ